jgi:hypothetical protein
MAVERPRRVQARPFPSSRRLVTAALRAGRRMAPMVGLVDVDVTTANRLLASHDPPWSLTAFVVASVARAAAAHPDVHAYATGGGDEMGVFFNPANATHEGGDAVAGADHLTCQERLLRKSEIPAAPPMVALLAAIGQRISPVLNGKDRRGACIHPIDSGVRA